ncbi:hypothetical protein FOZ63_016882 [Perkinsus olseni]|uniref:Uncharacterized protein n=1 Tax=Perkinsus olseni TaxID=32597 RepID=A0A7J6U933_PEROL|nr:hypothetical protein FOZ60_001186 [Perkinsus olseni]KAF4738764.1 hypothetical protein FOZ62_002208 [Perkinsus olseni]KAF4754123.1 hypothetical protein FOZ63_016882 [Perkinsus olseni]
MTIRFLFASLSITLHPQEVIGGSILFRRTLQYDPVLCDNDLGPGGKRFDQKLCLIKSVENSREMLFTKGLTQRHVSGEVVQIETTKPGHGGKNSKDFTLIPQNVTTYRNFKFKEGYMYGDARLKFMTLTGGRQSPHRLTLTPLNPIHPKDARVVEGRSFISLNGGVRLIKEFDGTGDLNWRICYEEKDNEYCRPSVVEKNEFIIKSAGENFKGTFYDLDPGHDEHIIMLANYLDTTVLLVREQ